MTNDYWEIYTVEEIIIDSLSVWSMSHIDLVDKIDIDSDRLVLRIIPDYIIPRFSEYQGFIDSWFKADHLTTIVTGHYLELEYVLNIHSTTIMISLSDLCPITIDLNIHRICTNVIDGNTGLKVPMKGLSPINLSKLVSEPKTFPKFIKIGIDHERNSH